jgi:hypothetical protein
MMEEYGIRDVAGDDLLDFPTNCGHSVKGVQSPWEVQ